MTTEERLESLERGLSAAKRRNKYLLIGLVALAVAWAFTITTRTVRAQSNENIVQAERFELVDSEGNVCAELSVFDSGPGLVLYDENGTIRAGLTVSDESGPGLSLFDENETFRARLAVSDAFGPGLALYDENEKNRAKLAVLDEFGPGLYLYDEDERPVWSAP
jgi:hypothetical protein